MQGNLVFGAHSSSSCSLQGWREPSGGPSFVCKAVSLGQAGLWLPVPRPVTCVGHEGQDGSKVHSPCPESPGGTGGETPAAWLSSSSQPPALQVSARGPKPDRKAGSPAGPPAEWPRALSLSPWKCPQGLGRSPIPRVWGRGLPSAGSGGGLLAFSSFKKPPTTPLHLPISSNEDPPACVRDLCDHI